MRKHPAIAAKRASIIALELGNLQKQNREIATTATAEQPATVQSIPVRANVSWQADEDIQKATAHRNKGVKAGRAARWR